LSRRGRGGRRGRANYRAAWAIRKHEQPGDDSAVDQTATSRRCAECAVEIPARGRARYCDRCRRANTLAHLDAQRAKATHALEALRVQGRDPAHGGRAARERGTKNATHLRVASQWAGPAPDPTVFTTEILPGLAHQTIAELADATGLSDRYLRLIKRGQVVPHPRHWPALRQLARP
jgi:hypothetical protein